ncbi:MFS transporter [Priestia megaterium]
MNNSEREMVPTKEVNDKETHLSLSFYFILIGDIVSKIGDYIYQLAIPLLVLQLTGSPVMMGITFAVEQVGVLIAGLFAGVIVDRNMPKTIVKYNSILQAILVFLIPLSYYLKLINIYVLFIIGFLLISANFLYKTSINSLIPQVVEKNKIPLANGRISIFKSLSKTFGPVMAGFLIATLGPINSLIIDGITFLVIFLLMVLIKTSNEYFYKDNLKNTQGSSSRISEDIKEGFILIASSKHVASLIGLNVLTNLGYVAMFSMLVYHFKEALELSNQTVGLIFAADGIGAFLAGMCLPLILSKVKNGPVILVCSVIMGVSIFMLGYISFPLLVGIFLGLTMYCVQIINRTMYTIWQMEFPVNKLGRIFSLATMLEYITVPIAASLAGIIAKQYGSFFLMKVSGISVIIFTIIILIITDLKHLDNRVISNK